MIDDKIFLDEKGIQTLQIVKTMILIETGQLKVEICNDAYFSCQLHSN